MMNHVVMTCWIIEYLRTTLQELQDLENCGEEVSLYISLVREFWTDLLRSGDVILVDSRESFYKGFSGEEKYDNIRAEEFYTHLVDCAFKYAREHYC